MRTRAPRFGALALAAFLVVTGTAFVLLIGRLGGPGPGPAAKHRLVVLLRDARGLAPAADVVVRGVRVGRVESLAPAGSRTRATLGLDVPVFRDATVRVGTKTLLGESEVVLAPGHAAAGSLPHDRLPAGRALPTVGVADALATFDAPTRAGVRGLLRTGQRALADPAAAARLSATLAGLLRASDELHTFTRVLDGQAPVLAGTVLESRAVLRGLAGREADIRALVHGARVTLAAVAERGAALDTGVRALPGVLDRADHVLRRAPGLLRDARPALAALDAAAPALGPALRDVTPAARDARAVLDTADPVLAAARPVLRSARRVLPVATATLTAFDPDLANLVTMLRYTAPRARTAAAWFANTAAVGGKGDAKGPWARFFMFLDPGAAIGTGNTAPTNPYTAPGDAAHNQPYRAGSYPRLRAYRPAR